MNIRWGLDMICRNSKGYRIGEGHHNARLTNEDVAHILMLRSAGFSFKAIAKKMECGVTTVYKIVTGEMRGHAIYEVAHNRIGAGGHKC